MLSGCVCFFSAAILLCGVSVVSLMQWMMSMTLWLEKPVLLSDLMIVCHCIVCSDSARWGCWGVLMLVPCVELLQQNPNANLGMGGIKIFALFFRIDSKQPSILTCSRSVTSGVYTASPKRCHPPSPGSFTASERVRSTCLKRTLIPKKIEYNYLQRIEACALDSANHPLQSF